MVRPEYPFVANLASDGMTDPFGLVLGLREMLPGNPRQAPSEGISMTPWLCRAVLAQIRIPALAVEFIRVEIDPGRGLPVLDRPNNIWTRR